MSITLNATVDLEGETCEVGATFIDGCYEDFFGFDEKGYPLPQAVLDAQEDVLLHALNKERLYLDQAANEANYEFSQHG